MKHQNKLIAITGGSGAGKTRLAGELQRALGANAARLSLDDFYLDRSALSPEERADINFDHPDAIDWPLFEQVLDDCRQGRPAPVPRYDFAAHLRSPSWEKFFPTPLVLVEGLWLFWQPRLLKWFDLKIFLDCPARRRLEQRLARDVSERGRSVGSVRAQFWETVAPMHEQFVAPQARWADLILKAPVDSQALRELVATLEMELDPAIAPARNRTVRQELQPA